MPPSTPSTEDPRPVWDQRFQAAREHRASNASGSPPADSWLERWQPLLPPGARVLDLGCGMGADTRWLAAAGCRVTAADFSPQALSGAQETWASSREPGAPASFTRLDLAQGLPFAPGAFQAVVANLSLHYFPWSQTLTILAQVRESLVPGGALLARFNSTRDTSFGAAGAPQIEPHALNVGGMYKRYFDRPDLAALFSSGWRLLALEELVSNRYGQPKTLWEAAALRLP